MATTKGLEPSTSGVTGRRSNRLNYMAICLVLKIYTKSFAVCQELFFIFLKNIFLR